MKTRTYVLGTALSLATALVLTSCSKNDSALDPALENAIAVPASLAISTTSTTTLASRDVVYVVQPCSRNENKTPVAQTDLPAGVSSYLDANYAGYTFHKAFSIQSSGSVNGYVVIIYFNTKPVALKFDASGNFVRVLEQRERDDMHNNGFHRGGRFEHRDGLQRDSIALANLPSGITAWFAANYPNDTLIKAFKGCDSSVVVISRNNGVFANVFSATAGFIKRMQLHQHNGQCESIDLAALPATAASYLNQTFPNYVFKRAFVVKLNGTIQAYVVIIDANNTKYAVEFDASGNFIRSKTIH